MTPRQLKTLAADFRDFRRGLMIEVDGDLVPLADCLDDWQEECFAMMDGALGKLVGMPVRRVVPMIARHWWTRPRGHSKTQDAAVVITFLLFAARRSLRGVIAAGDEDQAKLVKDAIVRLISANPWLAKFVTVERGRVYNQHTGSEAVILTSDAPTSFGLLIDWCWCDELVHWKERDDLWQSLASAISKKGFALLCVSSNAGWTGTWQHGLHEQIRHNPLWYLSHLDGIVASWWTEQQKEEPKGLLSVEGYRRLFENQYVANESRAISDEDLKRAVVLDGPLTNAGDIERSIQIGSLDIGIKNDRSALCVLSVRPGRPEVRLAHLVTWKPPRGGEVSLDQVEQATLAAHGKYNLRLVAYDPSQCQHLAQRMRRNYGMNMQEYPFTPAHCDEMAVALISGFKNNICQIYPHAELQSDFRKLVVEDKAFGKMRLTAVSDSSGHADAGIAYSIGLPFAQRYAMNSGGPVHKMEGFHKPVDGRKHGILADLSGSRGVGGRDFTTERITFSHPQSGWRPGRR